MKKFMTILTKVYKIWEFEITEEIINEAFKKYDKDGSGSIQVKDLLLLAWEKYKAKKLK